MNEIDLDIIASKLAEKLGVQPRWLKLKQAAIYSSIGQNKLILLSQIGKIKGFQDSDNKRKDWIFDKLSLDQYRLNQSKTDNNNNKKIAFEIVNSLEI